MPTNKQIGESDKELRKVYQASLHTSKTPYLQPKEVYTVIESKHINTTHHHCSAFEHEWYLRLQHPNGDLTEGRYYTWDTAEKLSPGVLIQLRGIDPSNDFSIL